MAAINTDMSECLSPIYVRLSLNYHDDLYGNLYAGYRLYDLESRIIVVLYRYMYMYICMYTASPIITVDCY